MPKLLLERARILAQIRQFFFDRDFLEVETPLLVPSPGLDLHLDAFEVQEPVFPALRYLITSPEYQMKRLLADGYTRIVQIAKCFRRGEKGPWHNPEFTMVEWYRAHAGMEQMMQDTEQLVAHVTQGSVRIGSQVVSTALPFRRMTVCEAFEHYAKVDEKAMLSLAAHDETQFFRIWVERIDPALSTLDHAVFVTDYPSTQASLARKKEDHPQFAERFELYVGGVELCNGFGELTDPKEQRARFEEDQTRRKAEGLPIYPIDERFLAALEKGIPPSGGNALGVDRLIALACNATELSQVISFPLDEL